MRFPITIFCGFILAVHSVSPSTAQESLSDEGMYLSFGAGVSDGTFLSNQLKMEVLEADTTTNIYDYQNTLAGTAVGALGYTWSPAGYGTEFRVEVEGSYRRAYFDKVVISNYCACGTLNAQLTLDAQGYLENIAAMANGYIGFWIGSRVTPYVGAGLGAVRVARRYASFGGVPASGKYAYTGAWQAMGGLGYRLSSGLILGLEFRHFQTGDIDFEGFPAPQKYQQQDFMLTFRLVG